MNTTFKKKLFKIVTLYIIPIVAGLVLILSVVFIFIPKYIEIASDEKSIAQYNSKSQTLNKEIDYLNTYSSKSKVAMLDKYLSTLNSLIPSNLQFSVTSGFVQTLGINAGLQFNNLSSGQQPKNFTSSVDIAGLSSNITANPVNVNFLGTYSQLQSFVNSLEKQNILFVIENLAYSGIFYGNSSGINSVNNPTVLATVVFFSMPDESNYIYANPLVNTKLLDQTLNSL